MWLHHKDYKNWIAPSHNGDKSKAHCQVCNKEFEHAKMRDSSLKSHVKSKRHALLMNAKNKTAVNMKTFLTKSSVYSTSVSEIEGNALKQIAVPPIADKMVPSSLSSCPEKNSAVVFSSAAGCDQIFLRKESGFFIVQLGATRFSCEESRDFFIDMKVVLCKFPALDGDKSPPAVLQAAQSASGSQPVKQAVPVLFSWSIVSLLPLEFSKITMFCCGCRWR
ncbi:hypothetical protein AVEN_46423-1 [Araneus ventricosus]|uniref:Uncharacterized protein n=1 Tax=Araneus ventricosus TaxID=182803 RepID=A0A4Y2QJ90_ARAVE|nr:hypothetical protein AVEN_46423-1 [Araneus ventricosus]